MNSWHEAASRTQHHLCGIFAKNGQPQSNPDETITQTQIEGPFTEQLIDTLRKCQDREQGKSEELLTDWRGQGSRKTKGCGILGGTLEPANIRGRAVFIACLCSLHSSHARREPEAKLHDRYVETLHCFYSFSVSLNSIQKYRARPCVLAETAWASPRPVTSRRAPGSQACPHGQGLHERVLRTVPRGGPVFSALRGNQAARLHENFFLISFKKVQQEPQTNL